MNPWMPGVLGNRCESQTSGWLMDSIGKANPDKNNNGMEIPPMICYARSRSPIQPPPAIPTAATASA